MTTYSGTVTIKEYTYLNSANTGVAAISERSIAATGIKGKMFNLRYMDQNNMKSMIHV